jgi:PqqD family protein of HPr-rel-A system
VTACLRAPGVLMEPLGEGWAVFSALSGETHLVNTESIEVLNALDEHQARTPQEVCRHLAEQFEVEAADLEITLAASWIPLVEAGLIRQSLSPGPALA